MVSLSESSGIQGYKLLLFKVDFCEIETSNIAEHDGQNPTVRSYTKSENNLGSSYLIFEVLLSENAPIYLPQMIINMSKKFLSADEQLKTDIQMYLQITSRAHQNSRVIEFQSCPQK